MDLLYFNILFTFCFVAFIALCRVLRAKDIVPDTELFFQSSSKFVKSIIAKSPTLQEKYVLPFYLLSIYEKVKENDNSQICVYNCIKNMFTVTVIKINDNFNS